MIAHLSLGSNLGDRLATLTGAVRFLASVPAVRIDAVSSVYETAPVGYLDQPPFLNAVVRLRTALDPLALLDACQAAEQAAGRQRPFPNAPRTLDVDIVSCEREAGEEGGPGGIAMATPRLTLPHARAHERDFVLLPLEELRTGCVGRSPGVVPWLWGWDPLGPEAQAPEDASDLAPHRLVQRLLPDGRYPVRLRYLAEAGSTNDEARRLAAAGAPAGTVVVAERQTAGRGRQGRRWVSAAGLGVWMTVLLRPGRDAEAAALAPVAAAVAVCRALRRLGAVEAGIKWPNDLLCRGRKIAGILCESASSGGAVDWLLVGIGINVLHGPDALPSDLDGTDPLPPTSLAICRGEGAPGAPGAPADLRARTAAAVLYELEETVRMGATGASRRLLDEYRRDSLILGQDVRVVAPMGSFNARAAGIDDRGRLIVETAAGAQALDSGEVAVRAAQEGSDR